MIRRFFLMSLFCATVNLAAFGQHIFGREDLIRWSHKLQAEAPAKAHEAMQKTDMMLASLAPDAGTATDSICTFDNLAWAEHFHNDHIRS